MSIGLPINYDTHQTVQPSRAVNEDEFISPIPVSDIHGVVLAGVHAWCSGFLDEVICWPLVPIAGRPLISHVLYWLRGQGIRSVDLCANSDTTFLHRYLGNGKTMDLALEYYEDVMPRGPAGSVRDAAIESKANFFVVVHGTIVPKIKLSHLLRAHLESKAALTMAAMRPGPLESPNNAVLKPAGIYIFSRDALRHIPETGYQDIKETLVPLLHSQGLRVATHIVNHDAIHQVTDTSSYALVNRRLVETSFQPMRAAEGYLRVGEAQIHKSARIDSNAHLIGPVIVGPDCVIENEVLVIGPTTIGENCVVRHRSVISRSSIWSGCTIGPEAILDDCILTDNSVIDDGLVVREAVCASWQRGRSKLVNGRKPLRMQAKERGFDLVVTPTKPLEPFQPKIPKTSTYITARADNCRTDRSAEGVMYAGKGEA